MDMPCFIGVVSIFLAVTSNTAVSINAQVSHGGAVSVLGAQPRGESLLIPSLTMYPAPPAAILH